MKLSMSNVIATILSLVVIVQVYALFDDSILSSIEDVISPNAIILQIGNAGTSPLVNSAAGGKVV